MLYLFEINLQKNQEVRNLKEEVKISNMVDEFTNQYKFIITLMSVYSNAEIIL